jgi:arginase
MKLTVVQVPYDSGRFGERMGRGPLHLVERGLLDALERAGHEVELAPVRLPDGFLTEATSAAALHRLVAGRVAAAREEGRLPVVLSGNCNHAALGTLAAIGPAAVVWMDAHGDLNTPETSASGFFDGMALTVALGRSWRKLTVALPGFQPLEEQNLVLVGARDLDPEERELIETTPISWVRVEDLRRQGVDGALGPVLEDFARRVEQVYLHFDLDSLDPAELTANGYVVPGGLTLAEAVEIARVARRHLRIAGAAITAYDPGQDAGDKGVRAAAAILEAVAASASARA